MFHGNARIQHGKEYYRSVATQSQSGLMGKGKRQTGKGKLLIGIEVWDSGKQAGQVIRNHQRGRNGGERGRGKERRR